MGKRKTTCDCVMCESMLRPGTWSMFGTGDRLDVVNANQMSQQAFGSPSGVVEHLTVYGFDGNIRSNCFIKSSQRTDKCVQSSPLQLGLM